MSLLEIRNLQIEFQQNQSKIRVVDDLSLKIEKGQVVGLVGESGCGKSVTAHAILGLLEPPTARVQGDLFFEGQKIKSFEDYRGKKITMIFQETDSALSPVFSIGHQLMETILLHSPQSDGNELRQESLQLISRVGLADPENIFRSFPHQLSGGMKQRIMIALALSAKPSLLIADEPTTALDVTVQAQILELLKNLCEEEQMSLLLITHSLSVVAQMCDEIAIMYAGKIVEKGSVFQNSHHPYTQALLKLGLEMEELGSQKRLSTIPGKIPDFDQIFKGCRFRDRCDRAKELCEQQSPELRRAPQLDHPVACHFPAN